MKSQDQDPGTLAMATRLIKVVGRLKVAVTACVIDQAYEADQASALQQEFFGDLPDILP